MGMFSNKHPLVDADASRCGRSICILSAAELLSCCSWDTGRSKASRSVHISWRGMLCSQKPQDKPYEYIFLPWIILDFALLELNQNRKLAIVVPVGPQVIIDRQVQETARRERKVRSIPNGEDCITNPADQHAVGIAIQGANVLRLNPGYIRTVCCLSGGAAPGARAIPINWRRNDSAGGVDVHLQAYVGGVNPYAGADPLGRRRDLDREGGTRLGWLLPANEGENSQHERHRKSEPYEFEFAIHDLMLLIDTL